MVTLPRLVIAAASTGAGKTTIATGLMAAWRARGHQVSGHKVGPDYIDPGFHAVATGRPGRNLDPHLVGEGRIVPLLLHGAATPTPADVAIIEGVMGLYDGRLGTDGFASTAHVATLTRSPVVLVLDVARMSRSVAAIVAGMVAFDERVNIAGVVLNRTGSARNQAEIGRAIEAQGLPVLGLVPRDDSLATPSRHLGLVPAAERAESAALLDRLGAAMADHLDLDALLTVARGAPDLAAPAWDPQAEVSAPEDSAPEDGQRPVIAIAGGRAFTFRYPETEELLAASGCDVVEFDPLTDAALPTGTRGIYLGGGFPEVYAAELAANTALLTELRTAVEAGIPTVAECAGLLYLARSLDGVPLAGAVEATAVMTEKLTLRYPVATAVADTLLTRVGEQVGGHEFHRTATTPGIGAVPAWEIDGEPIGFGSPTLHASYLHTHWAGHPQLAQRFADAVHAVAAPDLHHHGDVEVRAGEADFAVNVFDGPRPGWLDDALRASLDRLDAYPDPTAATAALAARHGRPVTEVLPTAGAAEAFTLIARMRPWRRPVVVHPQFTEPHAALVQAGHRVGAVLTQAEDGFRLDPDAVPEDADLVIVGNPTNPTGVLHPGPTLLKLLRPGRVVVVDEAFMDVVPGETASLLPERHLGLVVLRSLTKHWSIPGIRAGYIVGDPDLVDELRHAQTPWSVSTPALAAMIACSTPEAVAESASRATTIAHWRAALEPGLVTRGIPHLASEASYVLARPGAGVHAALRDLGVAVRRADTFPGLDSAWVRIAVRPPDVTARLFAALDSLSTLHHH